MMHGQRNVKPKYKIHRLLLLLAIDPIIRRCIVCAVPIVK